VSDSHTYGTERLNALSDGVFAIVLTLLVLELRLPEPPLPGAQLFEELEDGLPDLASWLVSFFVLARVWTVHHAVTANMERCHGVTIVLNFVLLGLVSLTPFTASLVGTYEFHEERATIIFSLQLGLVGLALGLFARHVAQEPELRSAGARDLSWHWKHHVWVMPAVALIAAVIAAFDHPAAGLGVWGAEFVVVLALGLRSAWHSHHHKGEPAA
jgi:uncharacterized membrane protein